MVFLVIKCRFSLTKNYFDLLFYLYINSFVCLHFAMIFIRYRKIPVISPGAYICSKGLFVIFLETLYGILGEEAYFRGGGGLLSEFYGIYYPT